MKFEPHGGLMSEGIFYPFQSGDDLGEACCCP